MKEIIKTDKGKSVLDDLITTLTTKLNNGDIRIRYVQRNESHDAKEITYSIATIKVEPKIVDHELSHKIEELADRIHYGQTYPLESLDELIALGEAAKKFKEGN